MAECCAGQGVQRTTVDEVCAAAGVSRVDFEREFAGLDECLGAVVERVVELGWQALDGVVSPDRPWGPMLRDGAAALLGVMAERPAFAQLAIVEAPLAGGRAATLHASARAALLDFLEQGRASSGSDAPSSAARGALAGAEALIERTILAGEATRLESLLPEIVYMLAVPFVGVGEAGRLADEAIRRRHLRAVA